MMTLNKPQKKAIRTKYAKFPLFEAIYKPLKSWENEIKEYPLSPEEVFVMVMRYIDAIRGSENIDFEFNSIWDDIYSEINEHNQKTERASERWTAILLSIIEIFLLQKQFIYMGLTKNISEQIVKHIPPQEPANIIKRFITNMALYGDEKFKEGVITYLESNIIVSQEIDEVLADSKNLEESSTIEFEDDSRMSIVKILLLAQYALDISYDPQIQRQSEIAAFLSRLTGYERGSIRTKIPKLIEMNKNTIKEASDLVRELQAIGANQLAKKISLNIEKL